MYGDIIIYMEIILLLASLIVLLLIWTIKLKRDIKTQSLRQHKLLYDSEHDTLTGLANGTLLMDRLSQAIKNAKRFKKKIAILYLGLDNFTALNDTYGISAGDYILKKLSKKIQKTLRDSDTVARIGGDEFIIILDHFENTAFIRLVIDKIMKLAQTPITFHDHNINITFSLGASIYPDDNLNPKTILENASKAMHTVKKNGKHSYQFYTKEFELQVKKREQLEHDLQEALSKEQMEVFYQFQIDSIKQEILGMQTSIVWNHPVRGLLLENEFLPLAKEINFIHILEDWVMQTSIQQFQAWHKEGLHTGNLYVKLSTQRLTKDSFLHNLTESINQDTTIKKYLHFSLEEKQVMQDPSKFAPYLNSLQTLGINLSINQVGTQCSSALALNKLPIHTIELDPSIIENKEVTKALLLMATTLNIQVSAAGIQTKEEANTLHSYGCTRLTGSLYHKASPAANIQKILLSRVVK